MNHKHDGQRWFFVFSHHVIDTVFLLCEWIDLNLKLSQTRNKIAYLVKCLKYELQLV